MLDYLWLINVRLLIGLNHFVAENERLYLLCLALAGWVADIAVVATFALLWFWPQVREVPFFLQATQDTNRAGFIDRIKGGLRATYWRWVTSITREESRAQLIVLALAGMLGYITARLIAFELDIAHPFASYLPVRAPVEGAFDTLRVYGSFPSTYAVLLAMLAVGLFYWDRWMAGLWLGLGLLFMAARVAVGLHYPLDILGGAAIGAFYAATLLAIYQRRGRLHNVANLLARSFNLSNSPYCYIVYFLVLLLALEFVMDFRHVTETLFTFRADILALFGR